MARFVTANGLRFAHLSWGPAQGPLALLAHGFPDTPATWRHLGPRLGEAGFRVAAPWMRGYAPTAVPADGDYTSDALAADLNRLHDALGGDDRAVLVGHDWGAVATYRAAAAAPDRWRRVVALAVPPEPALLELASPIRQLGRSWYMVAVQLPVERLGFDRVFDRLVGLWRSWSPGYEPTAEDLDTLRQSLRSPGSLTAALGYYRAQRGRLAGGVAALRRVPVPAQPTLYLHGADDGCMSAGLVEPADRILREANPASRARRLDGLGHFLHLEDPDRVGALVVDWCTADDGV